MYESVDPVSINVGMLKLSRGVYIIGASLGLDMPTLVTLTQY